MNQHSTILVAPLNWGLGHATRCIPIIKELLATQHRVIIGSDGSALQLLQKEFPELTAVVLPSYHIQYSKRPGDFKKKMLLRSPFIIKAIYKEHKLLNHLLDTYPITGVISDNRLGLYTRRVPTVFMTHQLQVLSGTTTWLTTRMHHRFIKKFDECWVPDVDGHFNLSGQLGHPKKQNFPVKYIGALSRFKKEKLSIKYDVLVLLSGPEPQRGLLEDLLKKKLKKYNGSVLFVRGVLTEEEEEPIQKENLKIVNYLTSQALETAINSSGFVISRSGYTTILDLAVLEKKAFFIPTPGQTEQEYLAERLHKKGIIPYATQDKFTIKKLAKISVYKGFKAVHSNTSLRDFFGLFERERKFRPNTKFTFDINFFFVRLYNMFYNRQS